MAFHARRRRACTRSSANQHAVVFYDLATQEIHAPSRAAGEGRASPSRDWDFEAPHHGLALTDDARRSVSAGRASDYAALGSAPDLKLIATIPWATRPGGPRLRTTGRSVVANTRSDDLSIISIPDRKEIVRLPIGDGPKHITVARIPAAIAAMKARS